jgi:hypothetical protein
MKLFFAGTLPRADEKLLIACAVPRETTRIM